MPFRKDVLKSGILRSELCVRELYAKLLVHIRADVLNCMQQDVPGEFYQIDIFSCLDVKERKT